MSNLKSIESAEDFKKICPILLYNLEIEDCELDEGPKVLNQAESKIFR